jgi:peptide/nickel transport system substrate-binding protein
MSAPRRRDFLAQLGAGAALAALGPTRAHAMGRTPLGGKITLHVPWPVSSIDPHDLRDPAAALFGSAIADPVYAVDPTGYPYPTLAVGLPVREAGETIVHLREGLRTARLAALDARDLVASVERARARGAGAVLADIPRPLLRKGDPLAVVFGNAEPLHVARALASPMVALLPRRFNPAAPDGTGAFRADVSPSGLILMRNLNAARGASFLDAIEVAPSDDLRTSLRAFEAERDDLGWLGLGLHGERKGAVRFNLGSAAWVVLVVGPDAGSAGSPGGAQQIVNAIPPERLAHLGLGQLPPASGDPTWTGPPTELYADDASPHLVEVARAVAPVLSSAGHEITVALLPRAEIARRRVSRKTLSIDLVRPLGPGPHHALMALATAEDPARGRDIGRTPARGTPAAPARSLTGLLRVGVIGDMRIMGGAVPDLVLAHGASGEGWDLGASYRRAPKKPI